MATVKKDTCLMVLTRGKRLGQLCGKTCCQWDKTKCLSHHRLSQQVQAYAKQLTILHSEVEEEEDPNDYIELEPEVMLTEEDWVQMLLEAGVTDKTYPEWLSIQKELSQNSGDL